ncbi:orc1/cdc6 family replication initiation protein (plasmid) [Haloferax larsenii]|uniref:ORC1-type DNA replication protein n=1 Tax=Haloferax larsenii TaxID=302484 RepID=A0ABY5RL79_HALLR|nr:orc1/cdc6 family replication initiation protein [Haloferax larsenii]UVE51965.1 orc1/cdc6 family replication initiation protein [Haloferax larsenii]
MDDESGNVAAEIFGKPDPIFEQKTLVDVDHVPQPERIVGRDDEIRALSMQLRSAIDGESPENVVIYGETGTGKSLVAKHVSTVAESMAEGVRIGTAYIDCSDDDTETQAVSHIARKLNDEDRTGVSVPEMGLSKSVYYTRLYAILDELYDVVLIILDEADMQADDGLLMSLSRSRETGKTDCRVGVVAISNKVRWAENLNDRVKSSLQPRELNFHSYDANQLRSILEHRRDAFRDGVLEDGVIQLSAALAAQDHGDARQAIDILRNAGMLAQQQDSETVTEKHVREARREAEKDRFHDLIGGLTVQKKTTLAAVTTLHKQTGRDEFPTGDIYAAYADLCEVIGVEPRTERRVRDFVRNLAFLDVLDARKDNQGRAGGITIYAGLQPAHDLEIVHEIAMTDDRFANVDESTTTLSE